MQYILDQEEFDTLRDEIKAAHRKAEKTIQRLCIDVAMYKPVQGYRSVDKEKAPWGCFKSEITNFMEYCDYCPVQKECPETNKRYSK